jgi:hypothetical protein
MKNRMIYCFKGKIMFNRILFDRNNTPTIPLINEVDITTSTLNELVQNMNDVTNREKELQRQQV